MKLWLNESNFIETTDKKTLIEEFAPRTRSIDWTGIFGYLPDPDHILRNLNEDLSVYRRLLTDAHVWSCYQSRKSGTLSQEWEIRESEKGKIRENKKSISLISEVMDDIDVYQIITDMLDAPFFGMSPIEVIWKRDKSQIIPGRIEGKPPEWFVFDAENNLRFLSMSNMIEGEEIPAYKFILARHHASYINPYGERVLSRCFWPVAFKKGGFKFWTIFTEKYGMPWLVGKVPRSTNDTERDALLASLVNMVQDAVAVINDDESVDIVEPGGKTASADIYEKLISACNREISKAILGQTLTTELDKGGSYAATKEHMEIRADLVDQDKRMVQSGFNLLFSWITQLNFSATVSPVFAFFEEEDVKKEKSERDKTLSEQGVRFTKEYYQREYSLQEGDFDIESPSSPPATAGKEFAEGKPKARYAEEITALAEKAAIQTGDEMERYIAPVLKMIDSAKSFEEIGRGLYKLYPDMEKKKFAQVMQRAMFAAGLTGYAGAQDEE